jgi:AcrR family transcriptional regulator
MSTRSTSRQRVEQNDQRILDAALAILAESGPDALTIRQVAARAGLTTGAIYGRYENTDELLIGLWERRIRDVIRDGAFRAVRLAQSRLPFHGIPQPVDIDPMVESVGAYLITVAPRNEVLFEVIGNDLDTLTTELGIGPDNSDRDRAERGAAVAVYLGTLIHDRISPSLLPDWGVVWDWWDRASADADPELPPLTEPFLPILTSVSTGDTNRDALIGATLAIMMKSGAAGATLTRISRRAGLPRTAVYSHFESRDDLIGEVVEQCYAFNRLVTRDAVFVTEENRLADAATFVIQPRNRDWRRQRIEMFSAMMFDAEFAEAIVDGYADIGDTVIEQLGLRTEQARYLLEQFRRFIEVIATGGAALPDYSPASEGIDLRHILVPFVRCVRSDLDAANR